MEAMVKLNRQEVPGRKHIGCPALHSQQEVTAEAIVEPCSSVKGRSSPRNTSAGKHSVPATRLVFLPAFIHGFRSLPQLELSTSSCSQLSHGDSLSL